MHFKTVLILLGNFSFGLINFVNLSARFFILRFLTFIFFTKNVFFNIFYSLGSTFFTSMVFVACSISKCLVRRCHGQLFQVCGAPLSRLRHSSSELLRCWSAVTGLSHSVGIL